MVKENYDLNLLHKKILLYELLLREVDCSSRLEGRGVYYQHYFSDSELLASVNQYHSLIFLLSVNLTISYMKSIQKYCFTVFTINIRTQRP